MGESRTFFKGTATLHIPYNTGFLTETFVLRINEILCKVLIQYLTHGKPWENSYHYFLICVLKECFQSLNGYMCPSQF